MLKADLIDQHIASKGRNNKISTKETELHQHGLGVVKIKRVLQERNQNIIENRNKAPKEKQTGHCQKRRISEFSEPGHRPLSAVELPEDDPAMITPQN